MSVATIILDQLGGSRFKKMTGASSFSGGDNMLSFRLPVKETKHRAWGMRITLAPNDTYHLELLKMVDYECVVVDDRRDVYAESLEEVFTDMTGLFTRLAA